MGNRAVMCFDKHTPNSIGIYVHWNGGKASIEGFLKATRILMHSRGVDAVYARGRLIQVVGMYFPGTLSFGVGLCKDLDGSPDNGFYIIDSETLTVKNRKMPQTEEMERESNELADDLIKIINASYVAADEGEWGKTALLPTTAEFYRYTEGETPESTLS